MKSPKGFSLGLDFIQNADRVTLARGPRDTGTPANDFCSLG